MGTRSPRRSLLAGLAHWDVRHIQNSELIDGQHPLKSSCQDEGALWGWPSKAADYSGHLPTLTTSRPASHSVLCTGILTTAGVECALCFPGLF